MTDVVDPIVVVVVTTDMPELVSSTPDDEADACMPEVLIDDVGMKMDAPLPEV